MICVLFFLSFLFFIFLSVFSLKDTNDSQDSREGRRNHYFSCFPYPAHEHSFSSSRFLPLYFNRSICNYQADSWWDVFSLEICRSYCRSSFQSDIVRIGSHIQLSPFYYKANALTNWEYNTPSNHCLSHLPNPTPSHHLSSIRLPKCIRNEGCFINKFSPLIIYLDFKATMATHKLKKKLSYRQSCLFSVWIVFQPSSEIIIADNKMAVATTKDLNQLVSLRAVRLEHYASHFLC